MSADDASPSHPAARPPHRATLPRAPAVQPRLGAGKGPHPATAQRKTEAPAKRVKAKGPHPATVTREPAVQAKLGRGRGPHPATVQRKAADPPKKAGGARAPHPATVMREQAGGAVQASRAVGKNARKYKKGSKGGVEVTLNGKKTFATKDRSRAGDHAERLAVSSAPKGDIALEQNAWPCGECHVWLAQQSKALGVTITVTVTDDHGSYSMDHAKAGVAQGATGSIVYAAGEATITTD